MRQEYKFITVMIRDEDYETLLKAQDALLEAINNPCDSTIAKATHLRREIEPFSGSALCAAAKIHEREEH